MGRSDRVEELETQVRELEATITGLTDELLECKQRLGEIEDTVDAAAIEGSLSSSSDPSSSTDSSSDSSSLSLLDEVDTYTTEGDESGSETETEEESDGIIVA